MSLAHKYQPMNSMLRHLEKSKLSPLAWGEQQEWGRQASFVLGSGSSLPYRVALGLWAYNKEESEANPNNNLMMRRAGLPKQLLPGSPLWFPLQACLPLSCLVEGLLCSSPPTCSTFMSSHRLGFPPVLLGWKKMGLQGTVHCAMNIVQSFLYQWQIKNN